MREMATASEPSEAGKERFPGWDDGGDYARAAEVAGVDVGGMLEAGVDAKQLLDFVSNYRKTEGETPVRPSCYLHRPPRVEGCWSDIRKITACC